MVIILVAIFFVFLFRISKIRKIYYGDLIDGIYKLNLKECQKYYISFFEGYFKSDERVVFFLKDHNNNRNISLKKCFLEYQFFYKGLRGFDYSSFKNEKAGTNFL